MRHTKTPAAKRFFLSVAGIVLALTAAEAFAAEDENWLLAGQAVVRERGSLLRGLLTWPKDEGDKEKEDGEHRRSRTEQSTSRPTGQLPLQLGVHQKALAELQHGQSVDRRVGRPLLAVLAVCIRRV